ncbi:hypothetical protein B5M09_012952 [Aphanomyces astaci]|uniref:Uncharacterized protein n=1 Tax=Aphanomyces astaci TaxID=112090 RepID=A0A425DAF3_APHAT|nr:hypothetical protein B5M09_012952 [Aphanomyces astaci]
MTVRIFNGTGWSAWLGFGIRLVDYIYWMQYEFNNEETMEALHDDIQLLLKGYDLTKYLGCTNSPENLPKPYTERVTLGLTFPPPPSDWHS